MKLTKPFKCVPAGEIYPVDLEVGDECPPEHVASAAELGAVDEGEAKAFLDAKASAAARAAAKAAKAKG